MIELFSLSYRDYKWFEEKFHIGNDFLKRVRCVNQFGLPYETLPLNILVSICAE